MCATPIAVRPTPPGTSIATMPQHYGPSSGSAFPSSEAVHAGRSLHHDARLSARGREDGGAQPVVLRSWIADPPSHVTVGPPGVGVGPADRAGGTGVPDRATSQIRVGGRQVFETEGEVIHLCGDLVH